METLFQQLLEWVTANPTWAYLLLFVVALTECLAVVGMVVPGIVIMLGAGALIATGALDLWLAWSVATLGAIIGDGLSYWLGRHLKGHIRDLWPFSKHPGTLERGERFFARYGTRSIAFGRFVGPVRAVVPMVAGMMDMAPRRFLVANVLSAIIWAPANLLPGIVFGASLKLAAEAAGRLVILALILILVLWLATWVTLRLFLLVSPNAGAWVSGILRWANVHPSMGKVALALADPRHPDAAVLTSLAGLLILASFLLGAVTGITLIGPAELLINQAALDLALSLHTPPANALMAGLSRLGDPLVLLALVTVIFFYLRWRRHKRHAHYWLAAAGFALVAAPALGWLLQVPRPDIGLTDLAPWSYPSIQVLGATVVYGFLAVALARGIPPVWRWIPYVVASLLVTAIAMARLYFGAEWLSNVVGSVALGLAWIAVLGLAFRRHSRFDLRWPGLAAVALATLAAGFTLRTLTSHADDLARYTPTPQPIFITAAAWREGLWRDLPHQRNDIWQRNRHPLDLQYAGSPRALADAMTTQGWRPAELLHWDNAIRLLSPTLPLTELPVIPQIHDGQHETLVLAKDWPDGRQRLVLRLWPTRYLIDGQVPLWLGNVTSQRKETVLGIMALPATDDDFSLARRTLAADLVGLRPERPDPGDPLWLLQFPAGPEAAGTEIDQ